MPINLTKREEKQTPASVSCAADTYTYISIKILNMHAINHVSFVLSLNK